VAEHVRVIGFDCNPQILCTRADGTFWPELHTAFHEEMISWGVLIPWVSVTYAHDDAALTDTLLAADRATSRVRALLESGAVDAGFEGDAVRPVFRPFNRCRQGRCGRMHHDAPRLACCDERLGEACVRLPADVHPLAACPTAEVPAVNVGASAVAQTLGGGTR